MKSDVSLPMPFSLRGLICKWFSTSGNIFGWVWSIIQWNLMARCISVDPLSLHHFSLGEDNFTVLHDSTKMDKKGEKLVQKHVYANPKDPIICPNLAIGIWFALNQASFESLRNCSGKIFVFLDRYCTSHSFET